MVAALKSTNQTNAPTLEPQKEYVSAGGFFSMRVGAALGALFNEAEFSLGPGGFEQMLTDPENLKDVTLLVDAILGDGLQLLPCFTDDKADKSKADLAAEHMAPCRLTLDS